MILNKKTAMDLASKGYLFRNLNPEHADRQYAIFVPIDVDHLKELRRMGATVTFWSKAWVKHNGACGYMFDADFRFDATSEPKEEGTVEVQIGVSNIFHRDGIRTSKIETDYLYFGNGDSLGFIVNEPWNFGIATKSSLEKTDIWEHIVDPDDAVVIVEERYKEV